MSEVTTVEKRTGKGEIKEFQGEPLNPPITYEYEYEVFGNQEQAIKAGRWPDTNTILSWLNTDNERLAKANEYQKSLKSKREAYEATREFKVKEIIKACVAAGMSKDVAE